jgi:tetratricopeptide (TPR) repeat protein
MRKNNADLELLYGARLPKHEREILKRDRRVPTALFFLVFLFLAAAEGIVGTVLGFPAGLLISLVVITLYLPLNFLFFCNVVKVGPDREFFWTLFFLLLCGVSLAVAKTLRLVVILPPSIAATVVVCVLAMRDPVVRFRRGVHRFERKDYKGAQQEFLRAAEMDPEWAAPVLFTGLALQALDDAESAKTFQRRALAMQPDLENFASR